MTPDEREDPLGRTLPKRDQSGLNRWSDANDPLGRTEQDHDPSGQQRTLPDRDESGLRRWDSREESGE